MYSKVVLNIFNNPENAGRISKPDGIAEMYNEDQTAHVEFSLRIESGIITKCQFRSQANPYIIAICSTITKMVTGKMVSMIFLDPYSIKDQLGDHLDLDVMFCIDCLKLAISDYKERLEKEAKVNKKSKLEEVQDLPNGEETISLEPIQEKEETVEIDTNDSLNLFDDDELTDEDFGFFDDIDEDEQI